MVRPNNSKSKFGKKPKRMRRDSRSPSYETLEARNMLAADLQLDWAEAMSLNELQKNAVHRMGTEMIDTSVDIKSDYFYEVDGQQQGMVILSDRIALSRNSTVLSSTESLELEKYGLTFSRPLVGSDYAVYTSTAAIDQSFINLVVDSGWANDAVPVFGMVETQSEAALLNEVIVRLPDGQDAANFFDDAKFTSYRPLAGTPDQFIATLSAGNGTRALDVINELGHDSRVVWTAPNFHQAWQKHYIPNDPLFVNQWTMHNTGALSAALPSLADTDVDLPEAWDVNQGGSSNIIVGVLDDGVDIAHADLNVYVGDANAVTDTNGNGWLGDINGWNFVANNSTINHTNASDGHGTATAGIATAHGDNAVGVAGAAYKSRSLSAKMFEGAGVATEAGIASAMYYLAGRTFDGLGQWDAADVISHSWGGGGVSAAINAALTWTTFSAKGGQGIPTFFSSGNAGGLIGNPANQALTNPGISVVGSITNTGELSSYHNVGDLLDFLTPSNNFDPVNYLAVETTDRSSTDGYNGSPFSAGDYTGVGTTGFGGTSAAAPLAAGIAALALAEADAQSVTINGSDMRALMRNNTKLRANVEYDGTTGHNFFAGYGLVNAGSLLDGIGRAKISVTTTTEEVFNSETVTFPDTFLSQNQDFTFRIRNQGTSQLDLSSISITGTDFTVIQAAGDVNLALGESTNIVVRFAPTAVGLRTGTLTIASNDSALPSVAINLEGTALAPNAAGFAFEDRDGDGVFDAGENALANQFVYLDTNASNTFDNNLFGTFTSNPLLGIPDNTVVTDTQVVAGVTDFITDINVTVNITHTWDSDMGIALIAPNGDSSVLFFRRGGSGDNLVGTIFDDQAATSIAAGVAPFTGSFTPEEPLSIFNGMSAAEANGGWTLLIQDFAGGDTGTLNDWSIQISTGEQSTSTDAAGFYVFGGLANGSYGVNIVEPSGWTSSGITSYPITIASPGDINTGLNFGLGLNNRYYAHVFDDQDGDGVVDGGELGLAGRTIFEDTNNNGVFDSGVGTVNTTGTPGTIISDNATVDTTFAVSGVTGSITDVNLTVNISHTWDADMEIRLISPTGINVLLFDNRGGSGDNLTGTVFDDEAATAIAAGTAPFAGSFIPDNPLSAFDGMTSAQANGNWIIRITDSASGDTGVLNSFDLKIDASAESGLVTGADGWVNFDLPAGSHNMRLDGTPGWVFTVPATGLIVANAAGTPMFNQTYGETQNVTEAVGRSVYYKGSTIGAGVNDRLDSLKSIAKEGASAQTLGYNNIINVTRGINGMVLDYDFLASGSLTNSDFVFQMSPQGGFDATLVANQPANWAAAPNPTAIVVSSLGGNTSRIRLEWADNTIESRWLRVTVAANANTGLSSDDVYYIGHLKGEISGLQSGSATAQPFQRFFVTNGGDVVQIRNNLSASAVPITNIYDLNKNGTVTNGADVVQARNNLSVQLTNIQIPAAPAKLGLASIKSEKSEFSNGWIYTPNTGVQARSAEMVVNPTVEAAKTQLKDQLFASVRASSVNNVFDSFDFDFDFQTDNKKEVSTANDFAVSTSVKI